MIKVHTARGSLDDIGSMLHLLTEVLAQPSVGHYIRDLDLSPEAESAPRRTPSRDLLTDEEVILCIEAALDYFQGDVYLGRLDEEDWRAKIRNSSKAALTVILRPRLPNLISSKPVAFIDEADLLRDLPRSTIDTQSGALCKLRHVYLGDDIDIYRAIDHVRLFSSLPSISNVKCSVAYGQAFLYRPEPQKPSYARELELEDCMIDFRALFDLIVAYKCLESFSYSAQRTASKETVMDPFLIRSSLLCRARTTLRSLIICATWTVKPVYIGSLYDFQVLEKACIDWSFLSPSKNGIICGLELPPSPITFTVIDNKRRSMTDVLDLTKLTLNEKESGPL